MPIKTVWGALPYLKLENKKDNWGRARGPVTFIPKKHWDNRVLNAHEEFHVKQWYTWILVTLPTYFAILTVNLWAGLIFLLVAYLILKRSGYRREVAAYGESLRVIDPNSLKESMVKHYATLLAHHEKYDFNDDSVEEISKDIRKAYKTKRLF